MTTTEDITELRISSEGHEGKISSHGKRITKLEQKTTDLTQVMSKMETTQAVTNTKLASLLSWVRVLVVMFGGAIVAALAKYLST